jgi:8-oxo-dGTP diphosphatase
MEPEKCEEWGWFSMDNLPNPLFLPLQNFMKEGIDPFKV